MLDHPETVRDQRVIDIASGSGLVAIAAASAGAVSVAAYDIDPLAAAAITLNAAANRVAVLAVCADILDEDDDTDVILVADAFYEPNLADRVMRFLDRGRARGADVLAADFGRAYLPRNRLTALAAYDVPGLSELEKTATSSARPSGLEGRARTNTRRAAGRGRWRGRRIRGRVWRIGPGRRCCRRSRRSAWG